MCFLVSFVVVSQGIRVTFDQQITESYPLLGTDSPQYRGFANGFKVYGTVAAIPYQPVAITGIRGNVVQLNVTFVVGTAREISYANDTYPTAVLQSVNGVPQYDRCSL